MRSFVRERGTSLGVVVLIALGTVLAQGGISYSIMFGSLRRLRSVDLSLIGLCLSALRMLLVIAMAFLWALRRKHALFKLVIIANSLATALLAGQTISLMLVLFGAAAAQAIDTLMVDVVLMAVANILIFSIWYWIIDPPGVDGSLRTDASWDFLFPQRAGGVPPGRAWAPIYVDYLFVAFTTNFAFSPTDTLPVTPRAKLLMMAQATISVVTLTGIAGSAINILAGKG